MTVVTTAMAGAATEPTAAISVAVAMATTVTATGTGTWSLRETGAVSTVVGRNGPG